jgi:hypothetical protein
MFTNQLSTLQQKQQQKNNNDDDDETRKHRLKTWNIHEYNSTLFMKKVAQEWKLKVDNLIKE